MASDADVPERARLYLRIPEHVKALLVEAAELQGVSLADFVVGAAESAARRILEEVDLLTLAERDQVAFAEALLRPFEPDRALPGDAERSS